MQEITILSPNGKLDAVLSEANTAGKPVILMIHGWTSSKDGYAETIERLKQRGIDVNFVAVSLSGHGANPGEPDDYTIKQHYEDVLAAYDFCENLENTSGVSVVGSSYGGYMTALLTKDRNPRSILMRVPAVYLNEWFEQPKGQSYEKYDLFKEEIKDAKENWALLALKNYKNPVTIVEHENDEQVPAFVPRSYAEAAKNNAHLTYIVAKGAPHSAHTPEQIKEFDDTLKNWIKQTLQ